MDRLTIYKASAGSGKTYRLTGEYLDLIFNPQVGFYNILAVTFTNKATAEMRERILKALYEITLNTDAAYANELRSKYKYTEEILKERAKYLLKSILYNYSRFNVSTIDSFFQKILKSFAYETGLSSSFNIELNLNNILELSIEQFIEKAQKKPVVKNWLMTYAIQKIENGKNWDIEKDILNFSKDAFNEFFFSFSEEQLKALSNIESFNSFKNNVQSEINTFINTIQGFGQKTISHIEKHQLDVKDFTRGKNGVAGFLTRLAAATSSNIKEPGSTVLAALNSSDGIEGWCTKTSNKQTEIQACVNSGLDQIISEYINYFNSNFANFNTAQAIYKGIDVFAIILNVFDQLNEYCRDKNIFLLPLASPLLSKMIGTDDAPFIYEKTGSYLKHFMIDEFQDTSKIQWENFLPLFLNGIAQNHRSLVVGDVKQSIYRWRNGDWTLLNHKLETRFKNFGVNHQQLDMNWRSTKEVVQFNNHVFSNIAEYTADYLSGKNIPSDLIDSFSDLTTEIYSSAIQNIPDSNNNKHGYIQARFYDSSNKEEFEQWCLDNMINVIEELLANGTQPKNIAILVRKGKEGALVAKQLMKHIRNNPHRKDEFSFVSNDSVLLGNSSAIILLISFLQFFVNKNNHESRASILYFYYLLSFTPAEAAKKLSEIKIDEIDSFLNELPKPFKNQYQQLSKQPFAQIVNWLLNHFIYPLNAEIIQNHLPFIHTFQDLVLDFTKNNGSDIASFLVWWEEFGVNTPINLSDNQNAIRIVTIHKSKGLEYNSVIIPFATWGLDQLSKYIWCESPLEDSVFPVVPVMYSSQLAKSKFANAYFTEKTMAFIDNLNLLYVAFTRTIESIYVSASLPKKMGEYKSIADLLYAIIANNKLLGKWNEEEQCFSIGNPVMKESNTESIEAKNKNNPFVFNDSKKLNIKLTSSDYFKNEDGELGKKINVGSIYHKIMEHIYTVDDIDKAVSKSLNQSLISINQAKELKDILMKCLNREPQKKWFSKTYKVLNETELFLPNQTTKRPDRVLIGDSEIIVIDYKFTQQQLSKHQSQVEEYMRLIEKIENKPVVGYVWYVLSNRLVEVL